MKTRSGTSLSLRLSILLVIAGLCGTATVFAGAIQQCADGNAATPSACNTTGKLGYTSGNIGDRQSHYVEGDSLPVRIVLDKLVVGGTGYTVTIGYDFTTKGKFAIDYLTSYDRTESINNNPCVGVAGCSQGTFTTAPIPIDLRVSAGADQIPGNGDDVTQIPGVFTAFGATITNVSSYTYVGNLDADSFTMITVTFTANSSNVVIAYGAHVATQTDWGTGAASSVVGSRYQNSVVNFSGGSVGKSKVTMLLSQ